MLNLYDTNGLLFWSEEDIKLRKMFEEYFVGQIKACLKAQNRAFDFYQVEAPLLTPQNFINPNYTAKDVFIQPAVAVGENLTVPQLVLRPETTMGSYAYAQHLLNPHNTPKLYPPIVVWQHGKSFRREQDQPTKFMRLKEFYQLEFQILYSPTTKNDYSIELIPAVRKMLDDMLGPCNLVDSDRIPDYAEWTKDVIYVDLEGVGEDSNDMEVCSISKRKDYEGMVVLEVAIGTDRCIYNFKRKIAS